MMDFILLAGLGESRWVSGKSYHINCTIYTSEKFEFNSSSKFAKLTSFILFVVGAVLLAVGCSVRWVVFPEVLDDQVAENLKLEPGTDTYDAFVSSLV